MALFRWKKSNNSRVKPTETVADALPTFTESVEVAGNDSTRLLDRVTRELYHLVNFVDDISASSQAVSDRLKAAEDDSLDDTFAQVNGELIQVSSEVAQGSKQALEACRETQQMLEDSAQSFQQVLSALEKLVHDAKDIVKVADTIDRFASQTKLLALNAQIESARAGKYGRGFAVVSEEVGKLAQHIAGESSFIRTVIDRLSENAQESSQRMAQEVEITQKQQHSVGFMMETNKKLADTSRSLPELAMRLDQFLEPLIGAREAIAHNQMVQIASDNLKRDVQSVHGTLRAKLPAQTPGGGSVPTVEQFIDDLVRIMVEGLETPVAPMIDALIEADTDPLDCLDAVGKAAEAANMQQKQRSASVGDYYLNYLVLEQAMAHLEPMIVNGESQTHMCVVIGNARGDYHSLGRAMVSIFLRASGIEVIDVGLGASSESFVDAAAKSGAQVVGVSSLLIESAKEITVIRKGLDARGLTHVKIVAGGACFVVDREFAHEIGADFVATAASDMVGIVKQVYRHDVMTYWKAAA